MDARAYFQSYTPYFWAWETDDTIPPDDPDLPAAFNLLTVPHVGVIGYRPYVLELLDQLADDGLPPFGALLLVLYASGTTMHGKFDGLRYHLNRITREYGNTADSEAALRLMGDLQQLDKTYRSPQHKTALLNALFEGSHNRLSPTHSRRVMAGIRNGGVLEACAQPRSLDGSVLVRDLHTLALIARKFPTPESLLEAVRQQPPRPEIAEEVLAETTAPDEADLLTQLLQSPDTFPVAALVKRLWSGLRVQMHPSTPGKQPLGGVSDIANKGAFDRLLLSEFAHPDELFLQRLANNEALYVQREIPPEENRRERILLTDVSLPGWGTPKVLCHAAALAIATHPKSEIPTRIFTVGERAREMHYHNAEAVFEGMQHVSATLDGSAGIRQFFALPATAQEHEIFLLMGEDTWPEEALQEAIRAFRSDISYLILTREDGSLQLFDMKRGGKKQVQTLMLPLEELWQKPGGFRKRESRTGNLPDYPLLLPVSNQLAVFYLEEEYYFLSTRKHLYRMEVTEESRHSPIPFPKGLAPLYRNISFKANGHFALGRDADGFQLAQWRTDQRVSILHLGSKSYASGIIADHAALEYQPLYHKGQFFLHKKDTEDAFQITQNAKELHFKEVSLKPLRATIEKNERLENFRFGAYKVLTNHNRIGINGAGQLQCSHYALHWETHFVNFQKTHSGHFQAVGQREGSSFYFEDGSAIHTDNEGMLTLRSSDPAIPDIYFPTALSFSLTLATDTVWAGNNLFVPSETALQEIPLDDFYSRFFKPFLDRILEYES